MIMVLGACPNFQVLRNMNNEKPIYCFSCCLFMWKKAPPCLSVSLLKHLMFKSNSIWHCLQQQRGDPATRRDCSPSMAYPTGASASEKKYGKREARQNLCKENSGWRTNRSQQPVATVLYASAFSDLVYVPVVVP